VGFAKSPKQFKRKFYITETIIHIPFHFDKKDDEFILCTGTECSLRTIGSDLPMI